MKFVIIFGPSAVGKMTVGKALAEKTGLKLFHNHVSLELAFQFFEFGTPQFRRLSELIRFGVFREVAGSNLPGLIFTFVWAFDLPKETAYVDRIVHIFQEKGAEIFYIELEANKSIRMNRNKQPDRIAAKPSKQDVKRSEQVLIKDDQQYRLNTLEGEFTRPNYIRINNEQLNPRETAEIIIDSFKWNSDNTSR